MAKVAAAEKWVAEWKVVAVAYADAMERLRRAAVATDDIGSLQHLAVRVGCLQRRWREVNAGRAAE